MRGYYGLFYDPTYILVIIGLVLCLGASAMVKITYSKYSEIYAMRHVTGAQAAEMICRCILEKLS